MATTPGFQCAVSQMTQEAFDRQYFQNNAPLLLTGLSRTMPAYTKWTFDFFKSLGQRFSFPVGDDLHNPATITRKMTAGEYITQLQSSADCPYMVGWSYQRDLPELDHDYTLPDMPIADFINTLPKHLNFRRRWIFFGKKNMCCDLHIDCFSTSSWIMMIQGKKIFRALSPVDRHRVAMQSSLFDEDNLAAITAKGIRVAEFLLTPGTILYIPSGWVHQIKNADDTIMVTGAFSSQSHTLRFYPNYLETIAKDAMASESVYLNHLRGFAPTLRARSPETTEAIAADLQRTEHWIRQLQEKATLYHTMLTTPETTR